MNTLLFTLADARWLPNVSSANEKQLITTSEAARATYLDTIFFTFSRDQFGLVGFLVF